MKPINQQAPVMCRKSIAIQASPEKVWNLITRINEWELWQTDIENVTLHGELKPGTTFTWKTGGAKIKSTIHTVNPFSHFGWTGKTVGLYAIHNWIIVQQHEMIIVSVEESMEGILARIFKKTFNKNLEQGMERWLTLLKQASEK
jgi:hypothetical protein